MIEMNSNEKEAWAYWLDCSINDFIGFKLHSNPKLNKSNQIIILVSKRGFNISIPSHKYTNIKNKLDHLQNIPLPSIADVINAIKPEIKKVGYILYQACLAGDFVPLEVAVKVVHLDAEKISKLDELRSACSTMEWDHSSLSHESKNTFGIIKNDTLVSAAHYLVYPGKLASLGMLTNPEHRHHGYALIATSAAVKHALDSGFKPHFQTIIENIPAVAFSNKLGFGQFGYSCRLELQD